MPVMQAQYNQPSDYFNKLIGDDEFRKTVLEEYNRGVGRVSFVTDEYGERESKGYGAEYLFDKIISNLDYNQIVELTENTYPRYFHHVNVTSKSSDLLSKQVEDWTSQRAFLESLDTKETAAYKSYVAYLSNYYKPFDEERTYTKAFQFAPFKVYYNNLSYPEKDSLGFSEDNYLSIDNNTPTIGNSDKNAIASEKLKKLLPVFDKDTKKKYAQWLAEYHTTQYLYNPGYKKLSVSQVENTYATLNATSLDSLMLYDYYYLGLKNNESYRAFFTYAYTDYVLKKYTAQDFDRLHNLLTVNGFPNNTPQYKTSKLQKIALLFDSDKYSESIIQLESTRKSLEERQAYTWSLFSLLYCLLGAIVFYVITLSTGIQFWISVFISGLFWVLILFLSQLFRSSYNGHNHNSNSLPFYFMMIHATLFVVLILFLSKSKHLWQRAHIIVNTVLISGIGSVIAAIEYWTTHINNLYYLDTRYSMDTVDRIRIMSNVLLVAILVYAFIAWFFKRHLTYPKTR